MRTFAFLLLLAGCPDGGVVPTNNPNNPAAGCEAAGTEYIQAADGLLTTTQFVLDQQAVLIDFTNRTTCVRTDGAGAAWIFEVNGNPYGVFRVETAQPGSLLPDANNLLVDLYGAPTPVRFTGADFAGTLNVLSVDPFSATVQGQAGAGGSTLFLGFTGTATP